MDSIRKKQLTNGILWGLGILGFVLLLPLTLPVVLGIGAAALLDPLILRLQKNTGMGRSAASALCVTGALSTVVLTLWLLGRILLRELGDLSRQLPQLLSSIVAGYAEALGGLAGSPEPEAARRRGGRFGRLGPGDPQRQRFPGLGTL